MRCWAAALRRFVWRPDVSRGNLATIAPGYHLAVYGLQNPMVQEAIRLGAYWDIAPPKVYPDDALDDDSRAVAHQMGLL